MVFVTVGNAQQSFDRLLKAVDDMAGEGLFQGKDVLIQSGHNREFRSLHCTQTDFLVMAKFIEAIREADLVICHAGAGTLFHVFHSGKVPVVMPRRRKYAELVDDHQLELVETLAAEGRVIPAYEPADLPEAIKHVMHQRRDEPPKGPTRMLQLIEEAVQKLAKNNCSRLR